MSLPLTKNHIANYMYASRYCKFAHEAMCGSLKWYGLRAIHRPQKYIVRCTDYLLQR